VNYRRVSDDRWRLGEGGWQNPTRVSGDCCDRWKRDCASVGDRDERLTSLEQRRAGQQQERMKQRQQEQQQEARATCAG
jgi:hypothetical protein